MIETMVQSRPAKKKLFRMSDGSSIEAENITEAIKIYNSKHEKV